MANFDLAVDIGSDFVSLMAKSNDVLVKQHNFVAVKCDDEEEVLACGNGAVKLFQNFPQKVKLYRPMEECNVKNKEYAECYFNWLFSAVCEEAFDNQRARVLCVVPSGLNSNEKKQIETIFVDLGARAVAFTETPRATQKLASREIKTTSGVMVDIGSTITDFGVFADGELKSACSLYLGGRQMDVSIKRFAEEQFNMFLDLPQAEKVKKQCSMYDNNIAQVVLDGVNYERKSPDKATVPVRALYDVLAGCINKYCGLIKSMIRSSDAELIEKIKLGGIYLTGGGAKLDGIADYVSRSTEIRTHVSADCANAAIYGAHLMLEDKIFAK